MQLGTRWSVGAEPPARLDRAVVAAIREVEAGHAGDDTSQWRWTLTWLEGRPVVELDVTGETVRVDASGAVTLTLPDGDLDD